MVKLRHDPRAYEHRGRGYDPRTVNTRAKWLALVVVGLVLGWTTMFAVTSYLEPRRSDPTFENSEACGGTVEGSTVWFDRHMQTQAFLGPVRSEFRNNALKFTVWVDVWDDEGKIGLREAEGWLEAPQWTNPEPIHFVLLIDLEREPIGELRCAARSGFSDRY